MKCRKKRFRSLLDARIALALHPDTRAGGQQRVKTPRRAYWHRSCRAWHLTSQPARSAS